MKTIIIKLMITINSSIMMMKTPMSMGILLLTQTMLSTMITNKIMKTSWMPMIIFLMLIGGLLILFMYMSSIASNEKFSTNFKLILMLMMLLMPIEEMISEININDSQTNYLNHESISMLKLYNKKTLTMTTIMFLYLLLTMIVVTKMVKLFKGPLRSKYE